MKPQVIICSTELPKALEQYRESVIKWSETNNYELLEVGPPNYLYDFKHITSAFDLLRIELLAERPYRLWVDWDVELYPSFDPKPCTMTALDYILWNHNDTHWFRSVLDEYNSYSRRNPSYTNERYRMYKVMKRCGLDRLNSFNSNTYKHFYYSTSNKKL